MNIWAEVPTLELPGRRMKRRRGGERREADDSLWPTPGGNSWCDRRLSLSADTVAPVKAPLPPPPKISGADVLDFLTSWFHCIHAITLHRKEIPPGN